MESPVAPPPAGGSRPGVPGRTRLNLLLRIARETGGDSDRIPRREGDGPAPLSFAQARLWLLQRMDPALTAYHVTGSCRIRRADAAALERALGGVVRRHETLRTVFREENGDAVQLVAPFTPPVLPVDDLSGLDPAAGTAEARRIAREEARRPYDLAAGPLFRTRLLLLGGDDVLLLNLHHIICDAHSLEVLTRELAELYAAERQGRATALPEPALRYADYAAWQRTHLHSGVLEGHLAYWRDRLAGAPAVLELPADHPRPARPSHRGAQVRRVVDAGTAGRLRALAAAEDATPFMVHLAAVMVLLARYAGTDDVVVGTPVAGRGRPELQDVIGFFANTVVLRGDLSGDPDFRALVRRVREAALGAFAHAELPFEQLVAELRPQRSLAHSPVFQVAFVADRGGAAAEDALAVEPEIEAAKFDLTFSVAEGAHGLSCAVEYASDLFECATAERMLRHLERILEQAAAAPELRISRLELAGEEERRLVVGVWNHTAAPYPRDETIPSRFAAQARRTPDADALVWGALRLTYRELDERANRLAHRLTRAGVGPERRVALLLERGPDFVVSALAVLKAGGCYLPLDPAYPPARLRQLAGDANARVAVSRGAFRGLLDEGKVQAICLDEDADAIAAEPADAPPCRAISDNLAYVCPTSGSTGTPKGVMVTHGQVMQLVAGLAAYLPIGAGDRVAQASSTSFDAAVFETWGALLSGATLVGVDRDVGLSTAALARTLRDMGITLLYQTASQLCHHVREQADVYASLRQLVFGAEAAEVESIRRLLAQGPPGRLVHVYGPTEVTAWCSAEEIRAVEAGGVTLPAGRPVPNARTYVVGPGMQALPPGVPGETCVGGAGVVRGYLGRPALTAERFVPDPFGGEPGARMYRTGDRMRWRADGSLEFMGRLDEQVKIRGRRIEPGEVERALLDCPGVRGARVVMREDRPGDRRLVAYLVGDADAGEVRARLRGTLPEHLVPDAFVTLERLPLTANGKLDRTALPAPEYAGAAEAFVAPRTPVETALAEVWREVLGVVRVGRDDGFFDLGGHSLLLVRLQARLRECLGCEVEIVDLFRHPTVATLARHLGDGEDAAASPAPAAPGGRGRAAVRLALAGGNASTTRRRGG